MTTDNKFDIIIAGGGLVGCSIALGLANTPLKIAIVEALPKNIKEAKDSDVRTMALSYGSMQILKKFALQEDITQAAYPTKHIHISDRGHFGFNRIDAAKAGVPALGYIIEMPYLAKILSDACLQQTNITYLRPATVEQVERCATGYQAIIKQDDKLSHIQAKLLVIADGVQSKLRQSLNIQTKQRDYGQHAIVANVQLNQSHNDTAYERFTETGPLAMLPMAKNKMTMVWTAKSEEAKTIASLNDQEFLGALQQRFGYRLGRFKTVGKRQIFPVKLVLAKEQVRDHVVLVGNAAHSIHPVAGQGFNLGLRDAESLAKYIRQAIDNKNNATDAFAKLDVLLSYQKERRLDQDRVVLYTDGMVRYFSNKTPLRTLSRNLGLIAFDFISPIKSRLVDQNMGLLAL